MRLRAVSTFVLVCLASVVSIAQNLAPPVPERITIHSNVLNEDRAILVRMPPRSQGSKLRYPVLYLTDGDGHINEVGGIADFLWGHDGASDHCRHSQHRPHARPDANAR